jgi:hypothetical protein
MPLISLSDMSMGFTNVCIEIVITPRLTKMMSFGGPGRLGKNYLTPWELA